MNILKNNLLLIFCVSLFLVSCGSGKKKESSDEVKEMMTTNKEKSNVLKQSKKRRNCRGSNQEERNKYKHQLEILGKDSKLSYFDRNFLDLIVLRIPVANGNFKIYDAYNVSKGNDKRILVVISDSSGTSVCGEDRTHILETAFFDYNLIHFKNNKPLELEEKDELKIFVLNEEENSFEAYKQEYLEGFQKKNIPQNYSWACEKIQFGNPEKQPKNGGGGVIVGFP